MDRRPTPTIALAASLAAAGVACAWYLLAPPGRPLNTHPARPDSLEHCRRAAELLYDVHWAAACFKSHDDNDCMLPDVQAAKVNAILASEEARCMAVEAQAKASP